MPFLGFSPCSRKLVTDNRIECYGWPIGITAYWFREIGSGRPGLLTKIGVDTFLDPRRDGAALNELAKKMQHAKSKYIDIDGVDYLLYQAPKPNYALIRASISDENGNLSMQDEGLRGTVLSIAQATKARPSRQSDCTGKMANKVRYNKSQRSGCPWSIVDYVIIAPKEYHWQSGNY